MALIGNPASSFVFLSGYIAFPFERDNSLNHKEDEHGACSLKIQ